MECRNKDCVKQAQYKNKCRLCYDRERKGRNCALLRPCQHCGSLFDSTEGRGNRKYCQTCVPAGDKRAIQLISAYGLSLPMYEAMYFEQEGQCAMPSCVREAKAVDHNHSCKWAALHTKSSRGCLRCVRALLCISCNNRLEAVEDELFRAACIEYLDSWPADEGNMETGG